MLCGFSRWPYGQQIQEQKSDNSQIFILGASLTPYAIIVKLLCFRRRVF